MAFVFGVDASVDSIIARIAKFLHLILLFVFYFYMVYWDFGIMWTVDRQVILKTNNSFGVYGSE